MNESNREIGLKGNGKVQEIIDGAKELETKTYLSSIISGTIKSEVNKQNAKKVAISEKRNNEKYDFSALGIGE